MILLAEFWIIKYGFAFESSPWKDVLPHTASLLPEMAMETRSDERDASS